MKISIGTLSPVKVKAIVNTLASYPLFKGCVTRSFKVDSGVSDQPVSLKETIKGAKNRAKKVFNNCDYSFGIESGLMKVPETKTGYMNASVCAIYDGKKFHLGIASCFEYPKEVVRLVFEKGLEISDASREIGLTEKKKVGYEEGTIGILTHGRLSSEEYYRHAVINALIHLENPNLF
jgi:inosine/xanthosine triphosphatase